MKKEELFDSIGTIDDDLLQRSEKKNSKQGYRLWYRWGAAVACLCICVLGVLIVYLGITNQPKPGDGGAPVPGGAVSDYTENTNPNKMEQSQLAENNYPENIQDRIQELQSGDSIGWIVINNQIFIQMQNYTEEEKLATAQKNEYLGEAKEFTGYYQNEDACNGKVYSLNGNMNIIYIELDNGATIYLSLDNTTTSQDEPADESTYQNATDYPSDITDIQKKISEAMSHGELPFVISSSIKENPLRLEVVVTTEDTEASDNIMKYDSSGKYIVLIYSENGYSLE